MTQDTRKDRRVKIVSLNVRYKSATVDEFIENHAHDVSRGGIYIKTANPFPAGTLLKFEIRLASDQTVITGVGRVVWKRDPPLGTGDRPAGMGVKFIKVDEPSKAVIDRLVSTRSDAGKAFDAEPETTVTGAGDTAAARASQGPPRPVPGARSASSAAPPRKSTAVGLGAVGPTTETPAPPPPAPTPVVPSPSVVPVPTRVPSFVPRPAPGVPVMFPHKRGYSDPPGDGQTVVKQAAELLEEALREAGGSMDEVGSNPLFSAAPPVEGAAFSEEPGSSEAARSSAPPDVNQDAMTARVMVAALSPAPVRRASPAAARAPSEPPPSRKSGRPSASVASERPARDSVASALGEKKSGAGRWVLPAVLVFAAGAGGLLYRAKIFSSSVVPEPVQSSAVAPSAASAPPPSASPDPAMLSDASTPRETVSRDAGAFDAGKPFVDAAMAASPSPAAHPAWKPPAMGWPKPHPTATATATQSPVEVAPSTMTAPSTVETAPTSTASPTASVTATGASPTASPPPAATAPSAPVMTATPTATAAPTATVAPSMTADPSAKPKPKTPEGTP